MARWCNICGELCRKTSWKIRLPTCLPPTYTHTHSRECALSVLIHACETWTLERTIYSELPKTQDTLGNENLKVSVIWRHPTKRWRHMDKGGARVDTKRREKTQREKLLGLWLVVGVSWKTKARDRFEWENLRVISVC